MVNCVYANMTSARPPPFHCLSGTSEFILPTHRAPSRRQHPKWARGKTDFKVFEILERERIPAKTKFMVFHSCFYFVHAALNALWPAHNVTERLHFSRSDSHFDAAESSMVYTVTSGSHFTMSSVAKTELNAEEPKETQSRTEVEPKRRTKRECQNAACSHRKALARSGTRNSCIYRFNWSVGLFNKFCCPLKKL